MKKIITYSSYFSGGLGLDKPFLDDDAYECKSYSEIEKHPSALIKYLHPNSTNLGDISTINIDELSEVDVIIAGFPCKGISTQGTMGGMANLKTSMVKYLFPIVEKQNPKFIILENVKNLLSKQMSGVYNAVKNEIEKQGYYCYTKQKDSSDYGTNQQRVRAIMYFVRNDIKQTREDYLANGEKKTVKIKSYTGKLDSKNTYISWSKSHRKTVDPETGEATRHLDFRMREDGLINTLTTGKGCVGASTGTLVLLPDGETRHLTPNEGEALQTWDKDHTRYGIDKFGDKYELPLSARYSIIGNGVPSNIVVEEKEEIKILMGAL